MPDGRSPEPNPEELLQAALVGVYHALAYIEGGDTEGAHQTLMELARLLDPHGHARLREYVL